MSKEVEAMVLASQAAMMALAPPPELAAEVAAAMPAGYAVETGPFEIADNRFAAEIFLNLGSLVVSRFTGFEDVLAANGPGTNPYLRDTLDVIDDISPFGPGEHPDVVLACSVPSRGDVQGTTVDQALRA